MEKPFRRIVKEYFNFSKNDRNAILALSTILLSFFIGSLIIRKIELKPSGEFLKIVESLKEWENQPEHSLDKKSLFRFDPNTISAEALDSLSLPSFIKRNMLRYRDAGGSFKKPEDVRRIYGMNDSIFEQIESYVYISEISDPTSTGELILDTGPEPVFRIFDPNSANKEELLSLGFNQFQASNLIKYRQSGGKISQSDDLLKIYGIDSSLVRSLENYIKIDEKPNEFSVEKSKPKLGWIELNSADSVDLVQLNGIGPVYASRIIKYRNLLGGFYGKYQLLEVYGFPDETFRALKDKIETDSMLVQKIRINFSGYAELLQHPYFRKEHVEAILNYRQKNGPFTAPEQLLAEGLVDTVSFVRVSPYITCR